MTSGLEEWILSEGLRTPPWCHDRMQPLASGELDDADKGTLVCFWSRNASRGCRTLALEDWSWAELSLQE